ncbi:bifunctional diaminohydroxyphosphoribosylaminopyrimidine deaminase/5-amino-6-(5-phosphoribosylamino)uracil reductase RibD [Naasia sp. SYSU D00057]|uniref:bifunctional diaminohydroxyphosphoribosylaminopyrimidine deaminase/5-amino-6-(5-phosphoribosylamino)uracil reductase RibD n=1 Tax=Naasia sp. SYSU D00057 TaxID=2817380 RepID=UPI001FEF9FDE|nr:bifunctional diaminohydroxyphosphoribosylaminopyrimidine deaminase/5-amino-6-(5-phosphoribosylamino)uracil reductase RibD [Naasia sp. SYSU D00057]
MSDASGTAPLERAMARALELGLRGPAWTRNPQVGCVLLGPDGSVLAEGWHRGAGTPHAEVDALSKLPEGGARGATAVVTLEPCNHTGLTGPCSEALIAAGVARVVYAVPDLSPQADGGAERLAAAGVEVIGGVLRGLVEDALVVWLTASRLGRPFVTAKWASSLDGRIAAADGTSKWITGPDARTDVHLRRAQAGAILVGTGTVLADDPALTARTEAGDLLPHQPIAVALGERPIPEDAAVRRHPGGFRSFDGRDLGAVLAALWDEGVRHVFVEGGPTLESALLRAGLVDEVLVYLAPVVLGGGRLATGDLGIGSIADARHMELVSADTIGADVRIVARPRREFEED